MLDLPASGVCGQPLAPAGVDLLFTPSINSSRFVGWTHDPIYGAVSLETLRTGWTRRTRA